MIKPYDILEVTSGGGTLDVLADTIDVCYITSTGTVTLLAPLVVQPSATLVEGNTVKLIWNASVLLNGSTITVFGVVLTQEEASKNLVIDCNCDGSNWYAQVIIDDSDGIQNVDTVVMTSGGDTINFASGVDANYQILSTSGIVTLLASYVFQPDAGHTFIEGDYFIFSYKGQIVLNGNTVTIFGKNLPQVQATLGNTMVLAKYDGSAWDVTMWQGVDNNLYRVLASSSDTSPDFLDQKVKNSLEVDSQKVQLVGDSASPSNNSYYGTNSSGVRGFYPLGDATLLTTTVALAHADILALYTTPIEVLSNPGAGFCAQIDKVILNIKGSGGVVTPYATNTNLRLITDTATQPQWIDPYILLSTVDRANNRSSAITLPATTDTILVSNKAVFVDVSTGNPTGGGASNTLTLTILYRIIAI